jgi:siroheme synthase-like protein
MAHFPIFIDIEDKRCLVIGGGRVAARKVETLCQYGAAVRVISPKICQEIISLLSSPDQAGCSIEKKAPSREELEDEIRKAILVVAASGDRETNHQTALISQRFGIPVNVVDAPSECTFLFPAVVKKGNISVGINTGGNSPIVSARIRRETEENIPDYYADIADQLGDLRQEIRERIPEVEMRRAFLKKAAGLAFEKGRALTEKEIEELYEVKGNDRINGTTG